MATATFGAGCFWGVEHAFRQLDGVTGTAVGFMGGHLDNPSYSQVCTDQTGHAEVVHVEYDPDRIDYSDLLKVFWSVHNPTTRDRQGPDIGSQYRSAIFYHSQEQEQAAMESKEQLDASGTYAAPIVTEIVPATTFWKAEEYHQQYYEKRGMAAACNVPGL